MFCVSAGLVSKRAKKFQAREAGHNFTKRIKIDSFDQGKILPDFKCPKMDPNSFLWESFIFNQLAFL